MKLTGPAKTHIAIPLLLAFLTVTGWVQANELTAEEKAWLEADDDTSQVSEGDLRFLPHVPSLPVHHIHNHITISEQSLNDGWGAIRQCHTHLDAVSDSQIVYRYRAMRGLKLLTSEQIERAWVEGQSVQMRGVEKSARLCIEAGVQILNKEAKGRYSLENGPYHRKFLEGYYPLHVTIEINYPDDTLKLEHLFPAPQAGLRFTKQDGSFTLDTIFEGMLTTRMVFEPVDQGVTD